MGAMPASGEGMLVRSSAFRLRRRYGGQVSVFLCHYSIQLSFPEPQRRLDCLDQSCPIFLANRDPVLDHLNPGAELIDFRIRINSNNLPPDQDPEVALLLEKIEERARLGLCRNRDPKRN